MLARAPPALLSLHRNVIFLHTNVPDDHSVSTPSSEQLPMPLVTGDKII